MRKQEQEYERERVGSQVDKIQIRKQKIMTEIRRKSQIEMFIKRHCPIKGIVIRMVPDRIEGAFCACTHESNGHICVDFSRKLFLGKNMTESWKRALILHEIGHIVTTDLRDPDHVREYLAQKWALDKARAMGWKNILEELKDRTRGWWYFNNKYRKYMKAGRIAKRKGLI